MKRREKRKKEENKEKHNKNLHTLCPNLIGGPRLV
jgi:hypothetical protein